MSEIPENDPEIPDPTSAVHVEGGATTVDVLAGDTPEAVEVEVGAVGQEWTEITGGLVAGAVVVLADLDEPLPGSATDGATTGFGGPRGSPG